MLFKDTSIQRKITVVIMITTLSALLLAMITLFLFEIKELRVTLNREISSIAEIVGANMTAPLEFDDQKSGLQVLSALKNDPRILSAEVFDETGKLFVKYENQSSAREHLIAVTHEIYLNGILVGGITITATSLQMTDTLSNYALVLLLALTIASLGAYFLSSVLRNLISAPILYLADIARKISQSNDYSIRADKTSDDETGILIEQFNNMLRQITKKNRELAESRAHLEESEYQLRLITDSLPVLIAYVDSTAHYQFANAAYENWFGIKREEVKGKSMKAVWGEITFAKMKKYVDRVYQGESVTYELDLGEQVIQDVRYLSATYIPDFNEEGDVEGFFALTSDMTIRKEQEEELKVLNSALEQRVKERTIELQATQEQVRQSERLASIGTLAAGIAHEIRNPLNTISLATQYAIKTHPEIQPTIKDVLQVVTSEAIRCADIIKNVLLFAKSEKTVKTAHDLNDVVKHAVDLAKSYAKEKFILEMETLSKPAYVVMNQTEIEQVVVNLISNAIEAAVSTPIITIRLLEEGQKIVLLIGDNGPGIPPELVNHIFDPFFSTKRQKGNTGLGLSLSHGIISEHGGSMHVQSESGKGTVFKIELPRAKS